MRFGLIANLKRKGAGEAVRSFVDWSRTTGHPIILSEELRSIAVNDLDFVERNRLVEAADILVSMGGDGTLLSVARLVGESAKPVLGINIGSLGFLTQLSPEQLVPALNKIAADDYQIEKRMVLKVDIGTDDRLESPFALNDIVIDNGPVSRLINISLAVNGEDVVTYQADGLVISTPTGSTAYSLAVGGPIMHPRIEAIIASPISSFSLATRPMIFSAGDELEIQIFSEHKRAGLTLDGQVTTSLDNSDRIKITRADHAVNLIVFPENSYYQLLKSKLHWGLSPHLGTNDD